MKWQTSLMCFLLLWISSAFLVVVVRGDARQHGSPQLRFAKAGTDVSARAPVSGDWRTSAESSSKENEKEREHTLTRNQEEFGQTQG